MGAGGGALIGALFALLFGVFFTGPDFAELFLYSLLVGGVLGALWGVVIQYAYSGGRRDFASATSIEADRYEIQVDAEAADEAGRMLGAMPTAR
jgi:hypothetical protein